MSRVAIVTGANQGLGLALVRRLCRDLGAGWTVYLTARSQERGVRAVEQLQGEGYQPRYATLDVTDQDTVATAIASITEEHGGLDIVIHNAAARIDPALEPAAQVGTFVATNNLGTTQLLRAVRPHLRRGSRLVVVASSFGRLAQLPPHLHDRFAGDDVTLDSVDRVMLDYVAQVEGGQASEQGWPEWINVASKIGQVAAIRVVAREDSARASQDDVLINAACPGLVDTDASRPWFADMSAAQSPDEAAGDVVWLATLPAGSKAPCGELVQHRQVLPFAS